MNEQAIEVLQEPIDMVLVRSPKQVVQEAREVATMLLDIIRAKKKPVKFNGEDYLEFEDWLMVARFYGASVMVNGAGYIQQGEADGYEAQASVLNKEGRIISSASAMCLNDERNWSGKPLFQLKSMAQTRACAKALRNVFSWIVVLGGIKPTPAEEMDGVFDHKPSPPPKKAETDPTIEAWENFRTVRLDLGVSEEDAAKFLDEKMPKGTKRSDVSPLRINVFTEELRRKFPKEDVPN